MLKALQAFDQAYVFTIDVVDLDTDASAALIAQYDELVPVLLGSKDGMPAMEVCHHFLDENRLKTFFEE